MKLYTSFGTLSLISQTLPFSADDLEVAPDFFTYFTATRPLLVKDKTLYCVSAWNDNGRDVFIDKDARG